MASWEEVAQRYANLGYNIPTVQKQAPPPPPAPPAPKPTQLQQAASAGKLPPGSPGARAAQSQGINPSGGGGGGSPTVLLAPQQRQQIEIAGLKNLDNSVASVSVSQNGVTSMLTPRQAAALNLYNQTGGSLQSPAGKELMKSLNDPNAPNNIASTLGQQPPAGQQQLAPGQNPFKGPKTSIPHALKAGVPQSVIQNPPDILKEFLESDPELILNAVMNRFRAMGASNVFTQWFGRNFDRFWGEYLGRIAQQAMDGQIPTLSFMDFMSSMDATKSFFSEGAVTRGDAGSRFSSFVTQSGGS